MNFYEIELYYLVINKNLNLIVETFFLIRSIINQEYELN